MTFNFSDILFKMQETISDSTGISIEQSEQISLWQLIWGYDSTTDEYSLTSMIVMTLLFTFSIVALQHIGGNQKYHNYGIYVH